MRKIREKGMAAVFAFLASISIIAVLVICIFLFARGIPAIHQIGFTKFVSGKIWKPGSDYYGIFVMIIGSLYVTAGALIIGVPVGIFMAVFMAKFCPAWLYKILKPVVNLLAGIPSIIYGYFGLMVIVPFIRNNFTGNGFSILAASIVRTLTSNIVLEMGYATDLHKEALIATGVILFGFILILNMIISILKRKRVEA